MLKLIFIPLIIIVGVISGLWYFLEFDENSGENLNLPEIIIENANKDGKLNGDYSWGTVAIAEKTQAANAVWTAIKSSVLSGISPSLHPVEKRTEGCQGFSETVLRMEGCMCQIGYWVEVTQKGKVNLIDTDLKLKELLLPIDSDAKAVSLVALTKRDLNINQSIPAGHTLAIKDGYLVQIVENNFCGCSTHQPNGAIYKVTKSGEVTQVATEVVPVIDAPEVCID